MLSRKFDIIFYCSHHVDEIWVRSTILELAKEKLKTALIISGEIPAELLRIYENIALTIIPFSSRALFLRYYTSPILISASTGLKRKNFSKSIKYFCHMPHSLISLHGAYPADAFDSFNVLFACNSQQILEFQKIAQLRQKENYKVYNSGYGKLDILLQEKENFSIEKKHILIAPSWGRDNIIETGLCLEVLKNLLSLGYKVTLRPHSALSLYQSEKLNLFLNISNPLFHIENFSHSQALFTSDTLITDYSGIYFEYYSICPRKIIFVETQKKIFNEQFSCYDLPLVEVEARSSLGSIVPAHLDEIITEVGQKYVGIPPQLDEKILYKPGGCSKMIAKQIKELIAC